MLTLGLASTELHFRQVLDLQRRNLARALSPEEQARAGFVYLEHSAPLLRRMAAELPQAVALANDVVVGYCLALPLSLRGELPAIEPMFDQFARCSYQGRPLLERSFFVGGQVCVDRAHRGRGLMGRLYQQVQRSVPEAYELCVTEIAVRNEVSVRAHERIGFEPIATYSDAGEEWVIVAWPLRRRAPLE